MIENFISLFQTETYMKVWGAVFATWPIWLPFILISLLFNTWFSYKRRKWIKEQGSVLLEIKLPREIQKTPLAMELVLNGIWEDVNGTMTDVFLEGRVRDWFSLEIVSIGGQVKFFIWLLPKWRNIVESRIYAEYPGVEIFEAKDYSLDVVFDPTKINIWGITTALVKPDAYPIKTYVDYELDKEGREQEETIDPMQLMLEYLGSLKPGEQAWVQIMIQAHRKEGFTNDARIFPKPDWREGVKTEIKKIIEEESFFPQKEGQTTLTRLTKTQDDTIIAIERNVGKLAFNSMMRILYTAPIDIYDKMKSPGLIGSMRHFASKNLNGIKPKWFSGIDYPWRDFRDMRKRRNQRTLLDAYKRRSFFNVPYKNLNGKPYILTTEELATLYHFPGAVVTTPSLPRVPSKKAEAPSNLPI
ncbi:MAG: hypothetical protein A3G05_02295 [Candidatus Zambryskibacteria bacterium RIFCSPLOWO2_12_FULL_45_14]|uniref:Uncharacterized protein n=2 Tax=Candidatus Zambryskiibacteriota TaxID=1817925 RepID=A0A1G2UNI3_9BACT|nr:MAG: hypothetical protein A3H60_01155 [Candidatus Zambryskibacteria bacterium RIFCSPLOWO2_02_FULL_44_12b]OHB14645.1 MAG: hypothetical protein A3G05_02295 [Candidatus Zambryskibacteria bacterium RIFCSPLOWO2_12_FULL_45_14]